MHAKCSFFFLGLHTGARLQTWKNPYSTIKLMLASSSFHSQSDSCYNLCATNTPSIKLTGVTPRRASLKTNAKASGSKTLK